MFWVGDNPLLLLSLLTADCKTSFTPELGCWKSWWGKIRILIHVFWLGVVWYQLNQPIPTLLPSAIRLGRMRWDLLASNGISPKVRGRFLRWQALCINLYHKDRLRFEKLAFKNNFHSLPPFTPCASFFSSFVSPGCAALFIMRQTCMQPMLFVALFWDRQIRRTIN